MTDEDSLILSLLGAVRQLLAVLELNEFWAVFLGCGASIFVVVTVYHIIFPVLQVYAPTIAQRTPVRLLLQALAVVAAILCAKLVHDHVRTLLLTRKSGRIDRKDQDVDTGTVTDGKTDEAEAEPSQHGTSTEEYRSKQVESERRDAAVKK